MSLTEVWGESNESNNIQQSEPSNESDIESEENSRRSLEEYKDVDDTRNLHEDRFTVKQNMDPDSPQLGKQPDQITPGKTGRRSSIGGGRGKGICGDFLRRTD